jgi:glucoamylase
MDADNDIRVIEDAPGAPGIAPTWTSSAKDMVGASLGASRLWFTVGFGIVNEVYFPRTDTPQMRDLGIIVADDRGFWSEVKRVENYSIRYLADGVPAAEIVHSHARYRLVLQVTADPARDALLMSVKLEGDEDLRPYILAAPHLGATGAGNMAAVGRHRGRRMLWAKQGPFAMALAAVDEAQADAMGRASVGYVGFSDGWQDFSRNGRLTWSFANAGPGNVALVGELPRSAVVALAFGASRHAAGTLAISSLTEPFASVVDRQVADWDGWRRRRELRVDAGHDAPADLREQLVISATVLRSLMDKTYPGAMVASLSVPWGYSGESRGGYHLVWPRDLVECTGALLALGAVEEARDTLRYLIATQNQDGHWYQNQWLGGEPFWHGVQLDEVAYPVLLAAAIHDHDQLRGVDVADCVRRALSFIARTGPSTDQDRWEESAGVNAFTLASCIAALVSGSAFLPPQARTWALELADFWNANIERWMTAADPDFCARFGVERYFIRTAPARVLATEDALLEPIEVKNRGDTVEIPADRLISTDFLHLVRLGLRDPHDPVILASLRIVDELLRYDGPTGSAWRRYNDDGYGEHDDGRAFDGSGRGRAWPLLTGERGHYELAAGGDVLPFLHAMRAMASSGGMIPEQIWDAPAIPARRLQPGRPSGSAMPLGWAHAEFVKLSMSRALNRPVDRPSATWLRYRGKAPVARHAFWFPHAPIGVMAAGALLAVALPRPATVHWGHDGWSNIADRKTEDSGLGFFVAVLETGGLASGQSVEFTVRWEDDHTWLGEDLQVAVR